MMPVLERRVAECVWPRGYWAGGREMDYLLKEVIRLNSERRGKSPEEIFVPEIELVDMANALAETDR